MKPRRSVLAVGGGMFVLAAASLLDMHRLPPDTAAARGDRLDVAERVASCGVGSLIAACANGGSGQDLERQKAKAALIQVFERPGETVLVRIGLAD